MFGFTSTSPPPFSSSQQTTTSGKRTALFSGFANPNPSPPTSASNAPPRPPVARSLAPRQPPSFASASQPSRRPASPPLGPPKRARKPLSPSDASAGAAPTSTELSCLSPDGRSRHSFCIENGEGRIVSTFAPFRDGDAGSEAGVTTILPNRVQEALAVDPAAGLLCVGSRRGRESDGEDGVFPWMCLHTVSSAFLLSIGYARDSSDGGGGRGTVLRIAEPFEKPLLSPLSPRIVRIRRPSGACRDGSAACLLREGDGYSVVLFHGIGDGGSGPSGPAATTAPLRFSRRDLLRGRNGVDAENEAYASAGPSPSRSSAEMRVVDFCFASFSILLLTNDGGVYSASPILFDGCAVAREEMLDVVRRMDGEIESAENDGSGGVEVEARSRQCKAARRYWIDAFSLDSSGGGAVSYYVTASVTHSKKAISKAMSWQSRLQGPLLTLEGESSNSSCQCIESFGARGIVEGFAIASASSDSIEVGVGILPADALLPRFEFESDVDSHAIDDFVAGSGIIVERACIKTDQEDENEASANIRAIVPSSLSRTCSIVTDPLDDLMLHVVSASRIATVSTTAASIASKCYEARLNGKRDMNADMGNIRTKVWSCFESAAESSLSGAGVSKDVHLGHILVASMSDGSMNVVNITSTQCIHEASLQLESKMDQLNSLIEDDKTEDILKNVKPLNLLLQPLTDKICDGLSKMGKIVGGNTLPKNVGPENVAVFIETQRSCGTNIVLPMEEMSCIITDRRSLMKEMHQSQSAELERLSNLLDEFKSKYESNRQKVAELESAASSLASRSSAVLTATRDLRPQITNAEAAYFKELERYEVSCNKWNEQVKQITNEASASCKSISIDAIESGEVRCLVDLSSDKLKICHQMLLGEKELLKNTEYKMNHTGVILSDVSANVSDMSRRRMIEAEKENVKDVGQ